MKSAFMTKRVKVVKKKSKPFLKWAGGKTQLLQKFEEHFPCGFNKYIEPFVGGGAVFFHLFNTARLSCDNKAILIDLNTDLINCYRVIKRHVNELVRVLQDEKYENDSDCYYAIRAERPTDRIQRAARIIYLNKTCFNGLYRVNSRGGFNVPFGRYKNPNLCDENNLRAVSESLRNIRIKRGNFGKCLEFAEANDFIYFDPPYHPLSETSNFTSYTQNSFDENDQRKLYEVFDELSERGCRVMLSNSNTEFIKELYDKYNVNRVFAKRSINSKSSGRGNVTELVIKNY